MADEPDVDEFYILDARTVVGNCVSWWCPDGKGYTCELDKAGLYSREHAFSERKTDVPIPRALAQALAITHVRGDQLRRAIDVLGYAKRASSEREEWWAEQQAGIAATLPLDRGEQDASVPWDASRIPPDMRSALTMVLDLPSDATDEQVVRAAARARSAEADDRHCMDDPAPPARGEPRDESLLDRALWNFRDRARGEPRDEYWIGSLVAKLLDDIDPLNDEERRMLSDWIEHADAITRTIRLNEQMHALLLRVVNDWLGEGFSVDVEDVRKLHSICEAALKRERRPKATDTRPEPARGEPRDPGNVHELKCWPDFAAVLSGTKSFELRNDDRHYQVGDILRLREYDPHEDTYSGRVVDRAVTYVCRDAPHFGLAANFVVLSLADSGPRPQESTHGER